MANHPDPNNHPEQPDDSNKKEPTSETNLGGTAADHNASHPTSDSFVDLGLPPGPTDPFASPPPDSGSPSDVSIVEWAALVEEGPQSDATAEAPKVDRPSDADWAAKVAAEESEKPTTIEPTVSGRPATDHAVNISDFMADSTELMADAPSPPVADAPPPPETPHEPDVPLLTDEDSEEQNAMAADLEVVRETFNLQDMDSHKKMTPPSGDSGSMPQPVNLAPDDEDVFEEINRPHSSTGSGSFSSSGVDLQQLDSGSFENIVDEVAAEAAAGPQSGSGVDLGSTELPKAPASLEHDEGDQPPSGRDLIAEAVESGMDMHQPLMEIAEEEAALEANEVVESSDKMKQPTMDITEDEEALEASEVVESSQKMKQPTMEIAEGEEALEAGEVVESSDKMKQPTMDIAEGEKALESGEVVESSSGLMKQPLLEVVEEQMAEEAKAAAAAVGEAPAAPKEESSAVNLGGPVETQKLNREEMDALLAGQELGSAAEAPTTPAGEADKADPRKTQLAGHGPARLTQLAEGVAEDVAEAGEVVEEPVEEAGEVVEEPAAAVEQEAAAEEVALDNAAAAEGASEIILRSDHPTIDSSEHLDELVGGPHSGVLLDKLKAKQKAADAEVDEEEVQLGVAAPPEEEAPAAIGSGGQTPPPKRRSSVLMLAGGLFVGLLVGAGALAGAHFAGLLPTTSGVKDELQQQKAKIASLETNARNEKANADKAVADLQTAQNDKKAAEAKATDFETQLNTEKANAMAAKTTIDGLQAKLKAAQDDAGKAVADAKDAKAEATKLKGEKDAAVKKSDDLDKMLTAEKKKSDDLAGINTKLTADKQKADADLKTEKANSAKLTTDLNAQKKLTKDITDQLAKAKFVDANASGPQVLQGINTAIDLAKMQPADIQKLRKDYADAQTSLKDRWEPKDMLGAWLPVLANGSDKDLTAKALLDADRVLKDPKATPQDKAKAQALMGLAKRNDDQFADSKKLLEDAKKGLGANNPWLPTVDAALKEVSNPTATYVARVDALRNKGDYDAALAALTKSIAAQPADQRGELLAERSLLRLEALRAKKRGPLPADDPDVKAAQDDADKAAAAGVPQGSYAVGRIAEEQGQWQKAVDAYSKAVGDPKQPVTAANSRYFVALARALEHARDQAAPPKDNKTSRVPNVDGRRNSRQTLALLVTLLLQPPQPQPGTRQKAIELANAVLAAPPGTVPFDVRAQALVIKGLYTEALKTYAEGLRTQLKPEYADGLMQIIDSHPVLRRPESSTEPNPLNAEKHFGAGLRWYYERDYGNAEKEFLEAIKNDALDARYFYFLGLSRLALNKSEAMEDFIQGAKLEAQERPSRAAVSAALERVQGPMREKLNDARRQAAH